MQTGMRPCGYIPVLLSTSDFDLHQSTHERRETSVRQLRPRCVSIIGRYHRLWFIPCVTRPYKSECWDGDKRGRKRRLTRCSWLPARRRILVVQPKLVHRYVPVGCPRVFEVTRRVRKSEQRMHTSSDRIRNELQPKLEPVRTDKGD